MSEQFTSTHGEAHTNRNYTVVQHSTDGNVHTHIGRVREARAHAFSWAHAEAHDALNFA